MLHTWGCPQWMPSKQEISLQALRNAASAVNGFRKPMPKWLSWPHKPPRVCFAFVPHASWVFMRWMRSPGASPGASQIGILPSLPLPSLPILSIFFTSICLRLLVYFPLLVLKGIYHYPGALTKWKFIASTGNHCTCRAVVFAGAACPNSQRCGGHELPLVLMNSKEYRLRLAAQLGGFARGLGNEAGKLALPDKHC